MKYDLFLSAVIVFDTSTVPAVIAQNLAEACRNASSLFTDYEIIVVDNGSRIDFSTVELPESVRRNCYIVDLARSTSLDAATLAGLERANGDYICVFDRSLGDDLMLFERMVAEGIGSSDIIYLRDRNGRDRHNIGRQLFFAALRAGNKQAPHPRDRREMLISRRALNWIVRHRNTQSGFYLNDIVLSSGFSSKPLETDVPLRRKRYWHHEAAGAAWATLIRSEYFLLFATKIVVASQLILSGLALTNALMVRFVELDIFGSPQTSEPGWAYVVFLVTLGFTAMSVLLYIIVRIQLVALYYQRQDPSYIVRAFSRM